MPPPYPFTTSSMAFSFASMGATQSSGSMTGPKEGTLSVS